MTGMERVYPLALGSVATGTTGYSMAGVLPSLARQLGIHPAAAGQLVTVFALGAAIAGPLVVGATRSWGRRRVVVAALVITGLGNAATALAPTLALLVGARIFAAVGVAIYVPAASALAAAVVAGSQRARAAAVVIAGLTLAMLAGVPVTTALLGHLGGYRGVFLLITGLCLLAAAAITMTVPAVSGVAPTGGSTGRRDAMSDRHVLALLGVTLLATVGTFVVYTYVRLILDPSTVHGLPVSILLACYGIGAVLGNIVAGWAADRWQPAWVLLVATVTSSVALLVLTAACASPVALVGVLMVWGGGCWSIYGPVNALLLTTRERAPILLAVNASCIYLGMAVGGLIGGLVIHSSGIAAVPTVAAFAAAGAAVLVLLVRRRHRGKHHAQHRARHRAGPAVITPATPITT